MELSLREKAVATKLDFASIGKVMTPVQIRRISTKRSILAEIRDMPEQTQEDQTFTSYEEYKRTFFPNAFQQEEVHISEEITQEQAQRLRDVLIDWSENFFSEDL